MLYLYCLLQNVVARRPFKSKSGVTAIEYGLIAALIAVVIITGVSLVGTKMNTMYSTIAGHLTSN